MTHAGALEPKSVPAFADMVPSAWRRLWTRRHRERDSELAAPSPHWTSGVTYRGYLGATSSQSATWMSEQQLRETQALLRMAANAGRLGAWAVALPAMDWTWSDEVKAIHDVPLEFQITTEDALAFYEPQSRELAIAAFEACGRHGTPFDLELQLTSASGRLVWIRAIGEAERDAEGAIVGMRGAIQDISKPKAVSDEARRTAERFTRTLELLTDGFILLDHDWRFVYLNPEAERILRRQRKALMGRSLLTEFPETASGSFLEKCMDASQAGKTVEFTKFYPPLGIWVHFKVWPSDQGLTFCIRDDTERIGSRREILSLKAQLNAATKP